MFIGSTPEHVALAIQQLLDKCPRQNVYCACSGNYKIDKLTGAMGFKVHSNDVSLYSKLIADIALGKDTTPMVCKDEVLAQVFSRWPDDDPLKKLICVMYTLRVRPFMELRNDYQVMMAEAFLNEASTMEYYATTAERLRKSLAPLHIEDFFFGDFITFLKDNQERGVLLAFPPTYKGGYEKMFKYIEETFEYEHAKYDIYDPKDGYKLGEFLEKGKAILYFDKQIDELSEYLKVKVEPAPGKRPVYLYSSIDREDSHTMYYTQQPKPLHSTIRVVPLDFEFTSKTVITAKVVKKEDVNYFKPFYMASKVNYTNGGDWGMVFFADGMAFGFVGFSSFQSDLVNLYCIADFISNNHTPKLSKLLIMLEICDDARKMITRQTGIYFDSIVTPVWTDKPVSMKYRGVFKLGKREKGKLTYVGEFNNLSLQETYDKWLNKYGKKDERQTAN